MNVEQSPQNLINLQIVSDSCAVVAGFPFAKPGMLTMLCLLWGFAVI
jgi:hypothetical protein